MTVPAVAVRATDLVRARSCYELLGFRFPGTPPDDPHLEAADGSGVRLVIDAAATITELYGEPPRPGTAADPDGYRIDVSCPLPS